MKNRIETILKKFEGRCDYLELRVERFKVLSILFRGKKLELLHEIHGLGGCARAYHKGGQAFASFNTLDRMESYVDNVVRQARLVGTEKTILAPVEPVRDEVKAQLVTDPRAIPLASKIEILKAYNDLILSADHIPSSAVRYRECDKTVYFGNSEGTLISHEKVDFGSTLTAVAAKNGQTQYGMVTCGSSRDFNALLGHEAELKQACREAVKLLDAPRVKGGKYTVILDPHLAGTFVHEAFGHTSEAEKVVADRRLREIMKIGSVFGSPILNIFDSGIEVGSRGQIAYDEEGVPGQKTDLIREGKLVGRLHTRETAGKLGEKPTGSARALDYRFPPIPRMRVTAIEAGSSSFDEMLSDIKEGVYAVDAFGGQSEEMFTFTAGRGYMIRNGKLEEMVKSVTLSGNLFTTLKNIDKIGNDYTLPESGGGCGKGTGGKFQFPLPVAHGAPHIRIKDVVVGGASA